MSDDRLALGLHTEIRRAMCGDVTAAAVVAELVRLRLKCGEPLGWQLRHFAPTGYEQSASFEVLREDRTDE